VAGHGTGIETTDLGNATLAHQARISIGGGRSGIGRALSRVANTAGVGGFALTVRTEAVAGAPAGHVQFTVYLKDLSESMPGSRSPTLDLGEGVSVALQRKGEIRTYGGNLREADYTGMLPIADYLGVVARSRVDGSFEGRSFRIETKQLDALRELLLRVAAAGSPLVAVAAADQAVSHVDPTRRLPPPCRGHADLGNLPATEASDTAGLGERIETRLPGWRLAEEVELGCAVIRRQTPVTFWGPEFGTGRAWWVRRADITSDGVEDLLVALTPGDDPSSPRFFLLPGAGGSIQVPLSSNVVTVRLGTPGPDQIVGCTWEDGGRTIRRADVTDFTIRVSNEMTWTLVYVWRDGEIRSLQEVMGIDSCQ
jgi:hypothetical protein